MLCAVFITLSACVRSAVQELKPNEERNGFSDLLRSIPHTETKLRKLNFTASPNQRYSICTLLAAVN